MKSYTFTKHLDIILVEMCRTVQAPFEVVNSTEAWFTKYSWTEEKEKEFIAWLINYLTNSRQARNELMAGSLGRIPKWVDNFNFNYGWKRA